jgi:hypothetical protein
MTNDERNPKPESRNSLSCGIADFVIGRLRFDGSLVHGEPSRFDAVHWDLEPVGRVTPCAPQFGNAQTARRGLTRPT